MKRIIFGLVAFLSVSLMYAVKPYCTSEENQKKFIETAQEVAAKLAPDYDLKGLHPKLFLCDLVPERIAERHGGGNVIMVAFMADTISDYGRKIRYDMEKKEMVQVGKVPMSQLAVYVWDNTFSPAGIKGNYDPGLMFKFDYDQFLRNNPDFKVEKYVRE